MRETRNGFQLMILLYSARDMRSRFTLPPTYCFSLDREPPEQEQSHAAPQKTSQSEEQAYLIVQRASWSGLTSVIAELVACVTKEGQSAPGNQAYQKKSLFLRNWICFLTRSFYFYTAFCLFESRCLAADSSLIPNASLIPNVESPSYILDLWISWSWG